MTDGLGGLAPSPPANLWRKRRCEASTQDCRRRGIFAAIPAFNSTPPSSVGILARELRRSTPPTPAPNTSFLDNTACNLASLNLMKFSLAPMVLTRIDTKPRCAFLSLPRKFWWTTPATPRPPLPKTLTFFAHWDWATPTWAR